MRTGKIGLRAFLFERRVPDVHVEMARKQRGSGSILLPAGGESQETTRRELPYVMHAPRFRHGSKGPGRPA